MDGQKKKILKYLYGSIQYSFGNGIENDWSHHEIKNDPTYFFSAHY